MNPDNPFLRQSRLLMQLLPAVAEERGFALKGGTAINLFVRDLPRLSVDIDLAYLPLQGRAEALDGIHQALRRIRGRLAARKAGLRFTEGVLHGEGTEIKLVVQEGMTTVKVEVSPVLRGAVFAPVTMPVSGKAEELLGYAETPVLSKADLYAGKLCAALGRQHPRDLFDCTLLLENEGLFPELVEAFMVYLCSHNRPMAELLAPIPKPIHAEYKAELKDMTLMPVSEEKLAQTQAELAGRILAAMEDRHRRFLLGFKNGTPDWTLVHAEGVEKLPAIQWKLANLARMSKARHAEAVAKLERVLDGGR